MEDKAKIQELRSKIDAIDSEIVRLLSERANAAHDVGVAKGGTAVYRPEREKEVIDRAIANAQRLGSRLQGEALATLYRDIMCACRALEEKISVAYLGPQGTFSEMAVINEFGKGVVTKPCRTIDEVFHEAEAGNVHFGVVPIENSTQGTVTRTVDLLMKTPLTIVGEVYVNVNHNLMNISGKTEDIKVVTAHPQALSQCQEWLNAHLPAAERVPASSNAAAALKASSDPTVAGIAATRAAELYQLKVVAQAIQDNPNNQTRFVVLGRTMPGKSSTRLMKTSMIFSVPNRAGSLFDALSPFKKHGVSMAKLESRPANNGVWDYNFYVDIEGYSSDETVARAIEELKQVTSFLKNLGSYPVALTAK